MPLALLAGWVDAVGVARLGGVFVAFMGANTTNVGIDLSRLDGDHAAVAALVVALFVVGVVVGEAARPVGGRHGRSLVMALVALLLGTAAVAARGRVGPMTVAGPLALAMGAQNVGLRRVGTSELVVNSPTLTLVRLGTALADGLRGQGFGAAGTMLASWLALACGALLGALSLRFLPVAALPIPAAAAAILAVAMLFQRAR